MSPQDGLAFLNTVRAEYPDLPFILFTGKGSEEIASDAISEGVSDYLQKGHGTDAYGVLARQIENVVERQRAVERFETFLESAPDSILIVDADGTITQVNHQTEELFDYDRADLLGEPLEMLLPERFRAAHVTYRERYMETPETRPMGADLDLFALRADGSEIPVDIAISPVRVGGRTEVMAAVRDISTRKWREAQLREREAQLESRNDQLEAFASVLSHDLRNPLMVAKGYLELARTTDDENHLEKIWSALERMDSLITELLALAREGRTIQDVEPVNLSSVIKEAWVTTSTEPANLVVALGDEEILADRGRLIQVFANLFSNAIEHGGEAITVQVGASGDGFYVADDGPGIPEAEKETIFDIGYSTNENGTGFGLGIVRNIVEAHGWTIEVADSDAGGARFAIANVTRP